VERGGGVNALIEHITFIKYINAIITLMEKEAVAAAFFLFLTLYGDV
jgi:hypothetical protein